MNARRSATRRRRGPQPDARLDEARPTRGRQQRRGRVEQLAHAGRGDALVEPDVFDRGADEQVPVGPWHEVRRRPPDDARKRRAVEAKLQQSAREPAGPGAAPPEPSECRPTSCPRRSRPRPRRCDQGRHGHAPHRRPRCDPPAALSRRAPRRSDASSSAAISVATPTYPLSGTRSPARTRSVSAGSSCRAPSPSSSVWSAPRCRQGPGRVLPAPAPRHRVHATCSVPGAPIFDRALRVGGDPRDEAVVSIEAARRKPEELR